MTLKRGTFKKKTIEEVRENQALKRATRGQKLPQKGRKVAKRVTKNKTPSKGYKPPKWFMSIKPGSHGSTPAQKRLWRVVSETYREEDFNKYGAYCPCCGQPFESWRDGQLGHWLRYSLCNSFMKWERRNLALICASCNMLDDAITLRKLGEILRFRYGEDILLWIEKENQRIEYRGKRVEDWMCVDLVSKINPRLVED